MKRINENGGFDINDNEEEEPESGAGEAGGKGKEDISKAEKPFKSFVNKSRKGASKSWAKGFSSSMKFAPMNRNDDVGAVTSVGNRPVSMSASMSMPMSTSTLLCPGPGVYTHIHLSLSFLFDRVLSPFCQCLCHGLDLLNSRLRKPCHKFV